MSEENKKKWKRRSPRLIVTVLAIITLYFNLWGWLKVISLGVSHYRGVETYYLPLLVGKFNGVHFLVMPFVAIVSIIGWLLSTRVIQFKTPRYRVFFFFNAVFANAAFATGYGMTKIQDHVLPFFYQRIGRVIETDTAVNQALFAQTQGFFFMLEMIPLIIVAFIGMFIVTKYRQHDADLKRNFFEFQWSGERLRKFENLGKIENAIIAYPDIELGLGSKTNEMVVLPGFDRTLNTVITGSIGTGKTAALGLPIINSDLHNITRFINKFPEITGREDYKSEEIQGRFINGLSIIEPSNDLCQKVYKLAKAHGISDKAITYIDPTNPSTPAINVLQGPTDKVAETFAAVVEGLANSGGGSSFFFQQAQRNHLKHFIYMLKMHEPEKVVTFDMLLDMYNDTSRVREMHVKLKERFPVNYEKIDKVKFRDEYNYWQILKGIDEWFDNVIIPKEERTPQGTMKVRDDNNNIVYMDAQAEFVQGLRNILNDIGANPLIRRVLFGTSDFNFDDHMGSAGGILLVNTAKGQLSDLSSVLGKIVLMSLQNAAFRREPNISTFHHILVDEAPEYLYSSFASFPAQSRKFKVIITILQQTLTQLRGAFGEDYMNTVVSTMRNRMVYADVSSFDSQYFEGMFGEKEVYQEGESEQSVSPLQDDPVSRSGSSYSKVKESALSSSEILFQDAFECAVKIVVNNKSMPVQQIKANFVPKEEFKTAIVQADPDAMAEWERARFSDDYVRVITDTIESDIEGLDNELPDGMPTPQVTTNNGHSTEVSSQSYDTQQMEDAVNVPVTPRPQAQSGIHYTSGEQTAPSAESRPAVNYTVPRANHPKPLRKHKQESAEQLKPAIEQTVPAKSADNVENSGGGLGMQSTEQATPLAAVTVPTRNRVNYTTNQKLAEEATEQAKPQPKAQPLTQVDNRPDKKEPSNQRAPIVNQEGLTEVTLGQRKPKNKDQANEVVDKHSNQEQVNGEDVGNTSSTDESTPTNTEQTNETVGSAEPTKKRRSLVSSAVYVESKVGDLEETLFKKANETTKR